MHDCVERLINYLTKELDIRLCALYFTESRHASDPHIFTAALLGLFSETLGPKAWAHVTDHGRLFVQSQIEAKFLF